jgi:hypothetical protein
MAVLVSLGECSMCSEIVECRIGWVPEELETMTQMLAVWIHIVFEDAERGVVFYPCSFCGVSLLYYLVVPVWRRRRSSPWGSYDGLLTPFVGLFDLAKS